MAVLLMGFCDIGPQKLVLNKKCGFAFSKNNNFGATWLPKKEAAIIGLLVHPSIHQKSSSAARRYGNAAASRDEPMRREDSKPLKRQNTL